MPIPEGRSSRSSSLGFFGQYEWVGAWGMGPFMSWNSSIWWPVCYCSCGIVFLRKISDWSQCDGKTDQIKRSFPPRSNTCDPTKMLQADKTLSDQQYDKQCREWKLFSSLRSGFSWMHSASIVITILHRPFDTLFVRSHWHRKSKQSQQKTICLKSQVVHAALLILFFDNISNHWQFRMNKLSASAEDFQIGESTWQPLLFY